MATKLLLVGENQRALFEREAALLTEWRETREMRSIDLVKQTEDEVKEAMGTNQLFAPAQAWRVTGLEKQRSPKWQTAVIAMLESSPDDVIVSVPQEPTPAFLKKFTASMWKVETFKLPKVVFSFLESIKAKPYAQTHKLFRQALESGEEWGLHALMARQFRLLLAAKVGAPIAGPPFMIGKFQSQAKAFTQEELLDAQHTLFEIEKNIKGGRTNLSWSSSVDRLLAKIYHGAH